MSEDDEWPEKGGEGQRHKRVGEGQRGGAVDQFIAHGMTP